MDLDDFLEKLRALLGAERDAERDRFFESASKLTLAERDARGLAVTDAEAVDESGLGGRALVTYERAGKKELGASRMGAGSLVLVTRRRDRPEDAPTAVVARRTRGQVKLSFDEPPPDWATEGRVVLELQPSAATHDRLLGGLRALREGPAGKRWRPVLAGEPLRWEQRPRGPALPTRLNEEQRAALELADRSIDVSLVHGPPGTGKTTVLVEIIRRAVARGETVLAAAPSNLAVDNLVERLVAAGLRPVRIGHPARVLESVLSHTLDAQVRDHESARIAQGLVDEALQLRRDARKRREKKGPGRFSEARAGEREARQLLSEARSLEAKAEEAVLDRAHVVCATLTGLAPPPSGPLRARRFALAVIDEATQAVEPAVYLALLRADRAVLAGDHLQLPPTILSDEAQQGGLGVSLFERLLAVHGSGLEVMLAEQHRMHEKIMRYPSDALYGGALRAHPDVAQAALDDRPFELIDTAGRGFEEESPEASDSRMNQGEAELAVAEVERVLALGVPPSDIAVISPYDGQVQRLRQLLERHLDAGLEVDTVDGFQGREKDAVIVSLVRSNPDGQLGFLADVRRINVAITRAKRKLVVIGDGATIARHPFYEGLITHAEKTGAWVSAWEKIVD